MYLIRVQVSASAACVMNKRSSFRFDGNNPSCSIDAAAGLLFELPMTTVSWGLFASAAADAAARMWVSKKNLAVNQ
jgi:hypothetical protein